MFVYIHYMYNRPTSELSVTSNPIGQIPIEEMTLWCDSFLECCGPHYVQSGWSDQISSFACYICSVGRVTDETRNAGV